MSPTAGLPEDIQELLAALDANDIQAGELVRDLEEKRFNWRPDEHSWSVAQCLDHLNAASRAYLPPMRTAVERARRAGSAGRGPLRPGVVGRWFVATLEPPPKRRLPAPKKIVPAARKARAEVMAEWEKLQAEVKALLAESAGFDLNGTRFVNPFLPLVRFSLATGFQVIAAHQRRHLWQAARVKANPGFPSPH
jgi:hypothetical protein